MKYITFLIFAVLLNSGCRVETFDDPIDYQYYSYNCICESGIYRIDSIKRRYYPFYENCEVEYPTSSTIEIDFESDTIKFNIEHPYFEPLTTNVSSIVSSSDYYLWVIHPLDTVMRTNFSTQPEFVTTYELDPAILFYSKNLWNYEIGDYISVGGDSIPVLTLPVHVKEKWHYTKID